MVLQDDLHHLQASRATQDLLRTKSPIRDILMARMVSNNRLELLQGRLWMRRGRRTTKARPHQHRHDHLRVQEPLLLTQLQQLRQRWQAKPHLQRNRPGRVDTRDHRQTMRIKAVLNLAMDSTQIVNQAIARTIRRRRRQRRTRRSRPTTLQTMQQSLVMALEAVMAVLLKVILRVPIMASHQLSRR